MGTEHGYATKGIFWPDPRLEFWAAESTYDEHTLLCGEVKPDATTANKITISASGTPKYSGQYQFRIQGSGFPGMQGTEVAWRRDRDDAGAAVTLSAQPYFGHEPPNRITWFQGLGAQTDKYVNPCAIETAAGTLCLFVEIEDTTTRSIIRRIYDPDSGWGAWSAAIQLEKAVTNGWNLVPTPVRMDDGTLFLYSFTHEYEANQSNIAVHMSKDDGATWSSVSEGAIPSSDDATLPATYLVSRDDWGTSPQQTLQLSAAQIRGQVMLIANIRTDGPTGGTGTFRTFGLQFASRDGVRFESVQATQHGGGNSIWAPARVVACDGLYIVAVSQGDWTTVTDAQYCYIRVNRVGSAFTPYGNAASVQVTRTFNTGATATARMIREWDVVAADDGSIWLYHGGPSYFNGASSEEEPEKYHWVYSSYDYGRSWNLIQSPPASAAQANQIVWFYSDKWYPGGWRMNWYRGRVVLAFNQRTPGATSAPETDPYSYVMGLATLGSYSTHTFPLRDKDRQLWRGANWTNTWVSVNPPTMDFASSTTGSPTNALVSSTADGVVFQSANGSGEATQLTESPGNGLTEVITAMRLEVEAGSVSIKFRVGDGSNSYEIQTNVTTTSIQAKDTASGGYTTATVSGTTGIDVRIAVRYDAENTAGKGAVEYRQLNASPLSTSSPTLDRPNEWTTLATFAAMTDAGTNGRRLRITVNTDSTARFFEIHRLWSTTSVGAYLYGDHLADGFSSPAQLTGRPVNATRAAFIDRGISVVGRGGPALGGETYTMTTTARYPVDHLDARTYPSPRSEWAGTAAKLAPELAWKWGDAAEFLGGETPSRTATPTIGLYLAGLATGRFRIQTHDGSSWSTLTTVDNYLTVSISLIGTTIRLNALGGSDRTPFVEENELTGGYVQFGADASAKVRKIRFNSSGTLDCNSGRQNARAVITLEGLDGTEPATTTDARIWFPRHCVIMHNFPASTKGIKIDMNHAAAEPTPPEGYFHLGAAVIGRVRFFGREYSRTTATTIPPTAETYETRAGYRRSVEVAPPTREVKVEWMGDPMLMKEVRGDSVNPGFWTGNTGGNPEYSEHELPGLLMGIAEQTKGPVVPVVLVQHLAGSATVETYALSRAGGAIFGTLQSAIAWEQAGNGEEFVTDQMRVREITIREIV